MGRGSMMVNDCKKKDINGRMTMNYKQINQFIFLCLWLSLFLLSLRVFCLFQLVSHQITEVDDIRTQRVQSIHVLQQIVSILAIYVQGSYELLMPDF